MRGPVTEGPITAARLKAARAFLKHARPGLAGPFAAITREAGRLGLPKHYRRDLTRWDRRQLMGWTPESPPFVWAVRECGTHLILADRDGEHLPSTLCKTIGSLFEPAAWFYYDGIGSRRGIHWIGNGPAGALEAGARMDRVWHAIRTARRMGSQLEAARGRAAARGETDHGALLHI